MGAFADRTGTGPTEDPGELRQRGLSDAQIEHALSTTDADWGLLAAEVRSKRFGSELPIDLAGRSRQTRFLESRGFTSDDIRQALGHDWTEALTATTDPEFRSKPNPRLISPVFPCSTGREGLQC